MPLGLALYANMKRVVSAKRELNEIEIESINRSRSKITKAISAACTQPRVRLTLKTEQCQTQWFKRPSAKYRLSRISTEMQRNAVIYLYVEFEIEQSDLQRE